MDTKSQFTFFLLSVGIGVVGGLLYELFAVVRFLLRCNCGKRKMLCILMDIVFCVSFAFFYPHKQDKREKTLDENPFACYTNRKENYLDKTKFFVNFNERILIYG